MIPRSTRLVTVTIINVIFFEAGIIASLMGAIIPDVISCFHISYSIAAVMPFSYFIAYAAASVPAAVLGERSGCKGAVLVSLALGFAGTITFATWPIYPVALPSLFLVGCCLAGSQVNLLPMLRSVVGAEHLGFFTVLMTLMYGLGAFFSPHIYSYLVTHLHSGQSLNPLIGWLEQHTQTETSWVAVYWVSSAAIAVTIFIFALVKFPRVQMTTSEKAGSLSSYRELLIDGKVWFFAIGVLLYVFCEQGVANWISEFLRQTHGMDPQTRGAGILGQYWIFLTLGCLVGLGLVRLFDSRRVMAMAATLAAFSLLLALHGNRSLSVSGFVGVGFFISVLWPITMELARAPWIPERYPVFVYCWRRNRTIGDWMDRRCQQSGDRHARIIDSPWLSPGGCAEGTTRFSKPNLISIMMKAALFTGKQTIEIIERSVPRIKEGEVLVRMKACGICGSEIPFYDGIPNYMCKHPWTIGHEMAGEVAEVSGTTSGLVVGDRVTVEPLIACGKCYACRVGKYNCCASLQVIGASTPGGFAEYVVIPSIRCHKVPDSMPWEVAALAEPYSIGANILKRGQIVPEDLVVINGAGPIGLTALDFAKNIHGAKVLVTDMHRGRLERASAMGADVIVDASKESVLEAVMGFTNGEGGSLVVDATGNAKAIESTQHLVAPGGRIVVVGFTDEDVKLNGILIVKKEMTFMGSRNSAGIFPYVVESLQSGKLKTAVYITDRYPFSEICQAFEHADLSGI